MSQQRFERGFTLVELLVVVGIVVVVIATVGTFFLAGPSPAVASAARDIDAAFDEARETATAFSASTVVFSPVGNGYSARVYRSLPGDAEFQSVNGPTYDSGVTIAETAAPLGSPGFAFQVDRRGRVTGYANFAPGNATFDTRACPATGAFLLALTDNRQKQTIPIPCVLSLSANAPALAITPAPSLTQAPVSGTCPPSQPCISQLPTFTATCPANTTPDTTQPNVCDTPAQTQTLAPSTPTPQPPASPTPSGPPSSPPTNAPNGTIYVLQTQDTEKCNDSGHLPQVTTSYSLGPTGGHNVVSYPFSVTWDDAKNCQDVRDIIVEAVAFPLPDAPLPSWAYPAAWSAISDGPQCALNETWVSGSCVSYEDDLRQEYNYLHLHGYTLDVTSLTFADGALINSSEVIVSPQ